MSAPEVFSSAPEAVDPPLLIPALLPDPGGTDEAIVSRGLRFDYATLRERIHRLGDALGRLGVMAGDVVAVMNWDDHRYLEAYFAVPGTGAILQTVNVRLSPDEVAFTLSQSRARVLLYHADFLPLVERLRPALPDLLTLVALDGADAATPLGYEDLLAAADPAFAFPTFPETRIATTFHTTGTVGVPKQVSFTHRQVVLHCLALATTLANQPARQGFRRADVYMPLTPMFHVQAWGLPYIATMLGTRQVYPGRYDPATIVALQRSEGVTFSHCVPTVLDLVLGAMGDEPAATWTMVIGGAALSEALAARAARAGIATFAGYGMSETGPALAIARSEAGDPAALRRAGRPLPLVRLALDGAPAGELLVRAPWLTQGYAGRPEDSEALWHGGWLHTGDVARLTARGEVEIVDRLKDVIKSGGEWISSPDIEGLAAQHPAVAAAALVGIDDPRWGERPVLFVVAADPGGPLPDLRGYLADHAAAGRISRYAVPDRVIAIEALPLTSVGKINKKVLRASLAAPD